MNEITRRIKEEHDELRRRMEPLRRLLYDTPMREGPEREAIVRAALTWIKNDVLTHAAHEERGLYPLVDRLMQSKEPASATMVMDHEQLRRLTRQLEELLEATDEERPQRWAWIMMIASQLEMLLTLHLEKEEDVYLAVLERHATPEDLDDLRSYAHHEG